MAAVKVPTPVMIKIIAKPLPAAVCGWISPYPTVVLTYTGFSKNWSGWRGYDSTGSSGMNGELDEVLNGRKSLDDAIEALVIYGNDVLSR